MKTIGCASVCRTRGDHSLPRGRRPSNSERTPGSVRFVFIPNSVLQGPPEAWPPLICSPRRLHALGAQGRPPPALPEPARQRRGRPRRPPAPRRLPRNPSREPGTARRGRREGTRTGAGAGCAPRLRGRRGGPQLLRAAARPARARHPEAGAGHGRAGQACISGSRGPAPPPPRSGPPRSSTEGPRLAARGRGGEAVGARGGLTSNMSPSRKTIATQETMSA